MPGTNTSNIVCRPQTLVKAPLFAYGDNGWHSDTSKKNPRPLGSISKAGIIELFNTPNKFEKDQAPYVLPSTLLTRTFSEQHKSGQFGFSWVDIDAANIPKAQVAAALQDAIPGYEFFLHTSSSSTADKLKWHVLIFYTDLVPYPIWYGMQAWLNSIFEAAGIIPDTTNVRPGQLCFLPNTAKGFYDNHHERGVTINPLNVSDLPTPPITPPINTAHLGRENPNFERLLELLDGVDFRGDAIDVICPWSEGHEGSPMAWIGSSGGFNCMHDNCDGKNIGHVYAHYGLTQVTDVKAAFATRAILPPGAKLMPALIQAPNLTPQEVLDLCTGSTPETLPECYTAIATLDQLLQGTCKLKLKEAIDHLPMAMINKGVTAAIGAKRKAAKEQRIVSGHPLADEFNIILPDGTLNANGFGVIYGDKMTIAKASVDPLGNPRISWQSVKDFKEYGETLPEFYDVTTDKTLNRAEAWYKSGADHHNAFDGLTFFPGQPRTVGRPGRFGRQLNTWTKPKTEPAAKVDTSKIQNFLNHIHTYFCSGNMEQFNYFINWCADIFQHPATKPKIALMLSGGIGTGKSEVADAIGALLDGNYVAVVGAGALSPDFNHHLASRLLIHADEFDERGAKASSRTRALITSPVFNSNDKNKSLLQLPCYARILASTNEASGIQTKDGERRFCWFDCVEDMPGEPNTDERTTAMAPLFENLRGEGFKENLLAYFMQRDLSLFNVRQPPNTKKKEVALLAGDIVTRWWHTCCDDGEFYNPQNKLTKIPFTPGGAVPTKSIRESIEAYCDHHNTGKPSDAHRGRKLRKLGIIKNPKHNRLYILPSKLEVIL